MPSWPTYNCLNNIISPHGPNLTPKVKAIRSHKNNFSHKKVTEKKKKICHRENENKTKTNSAFAWRRIAILVAIVRMYL